MGNIRYCRQCGHALSDESRFCEYCGAKVEREAPRTQRPQESGVFHLVETAVRRDRAHAASLELMSRAAGAYQCQMLKRV